ncbi:Got1/Sft2-like family-domain-containing protein, partial [Mrakia frigida]|uniref:Got1/Sft2-like family vesicle transport protein n=1 Tax=Mrakia frigida TaxID=29902 RepID=UPI003FCBEE8D
FCACTAAGFVLSIVGAILLFIGATIAFAFLYAVGTILSLVGTGFLVGFWKQVKMMFNPVRLIASIVFLGSIVLVFVGAFVLGNAILCIVFVVISYLAFAWYSLSYVQPQLSSNLSSFSFSLTLSLSVPSPSDTSPTLERWSRTRLGRSWPNLLRFEKDGRRNWVASRRYGSKEEGGNGLRVSVFASILLMQIAF